MPLYESVMQEKPPVILDIGSAYTKLGFAAEANPRKIIPSEVILSTNGRTQALFQYADSHELYDLMVDFMQMIFFKHLLVSPKERKIVIVENVFGATLVRETLARVLFRHLEVSSVVFVPAHIIALSSLAVASGVVVDIGYSETTIMPVLSGVQIIQAFQDQTYGGHLVHEEIKRQLLQVGNVCMESITETMLEDIKVRTCFVTTLQRAQDYRYNSSPKVLPPSIEYPICDEEIVLISGKLRETAFEVFFEESNERNNLPHLILRAILRCPIDARRLLAQSICVIGGSAIIMGLLPRLKAELNHLLQTDPEYKLKLPTDMLFKFHKTVGRQNFTAWLGGALYGGTDLVQTRSLTKETFMKIERVPDWVCLNDNRMDSSAKII